MRDLAYHPRDDGHSEREQGVGYAVVDDGLQTGIAEYHLLGADGGRVAAICGVDVGVEHAAHLREHLDKLCCRRGGVALKCGIVGRVAVVVENHAGGNLFRQHFVQASAVDSDEVFKVVDVHIVVAVEPRKQDCAAEVDDFLNRGLSRKGLAAPAEMAHRA